LPIFFQSHYYQPGFTLAAAGLMKFNSLHRKEIVVIPRGVDWFLDDVTKFMPQKNSVLLRYSPILNVVLNHPIF
jgi:hypothetical protein